MKQAKVNYSPEAVEQLKALYAEKGNAGLTEIAQALNKTVRSVRAKLVREGVYVAPEKATKSAQADEGPSKKELLGQLENLGVNAEGFEGATKAALQRVIALAA